MGNRKANRGTISPWNVCILYYRLNCMEICSCQATEIKWCNSWPSHFKKEATKDWSSNPFGKSSKRSQQYGKSYEFLFLGKTAFGRTGHYSGSRGGNEGYASEGRIHDWWRALLTWRIDAAEVAKASPAKQRVIVEIPPEILEAAANGPGTTLGQPH